METAVVKYLVKYKQILYKVIAITVFPFSEIKKQNA